MLVKIAMVGSSLNQNGGIATCQKLIVKHAPTELQIEHVTSFNDGFIGAKLIIFAQALIKLVRIFIFQKTDIVHVHVSERGSILRKCIVALIAFAFRKPVLIHAHGAEFHLNYPQLPQLAKQLVAKIFRQSNGLIVLSNSWKEYYVLNLGLNPQQVFVLSNPTEISQHLNKNKDNNKVTLLFCGRVGERKGTFDLIRAFANLPTEQKNCAELIIAGDGDVEQGQKLIETLNLSEYVTFLGWVNSEQRDQLLAKADIFLLPSYNEGLPMAILEAMSWELPVITTPVGGIPELIISNENGLLVEPGDVQNLSAAMQSLISNEELRLKLGKSARKSVMPFDIKNYMKSLLNIYCLVIDSYKKKQSISRESLH